jgi:hypothetical protein
LVVIASLAISVIFIILLKAEVSFALRGRITVVCAITFGVISKKYAIIEGTPSFSALSLACAASTDPVSANLGVAVLEIFASCCNTDIIGALQGSRTTFEVVITLSTVSRLAEI